MAILIKTKTDISLLYDDIFSSDFTIQNSPSLFSS